MCTGSPSVSGIKSLAHDVLFISFSFFVAQQIIKRNNSLLLFFWVKTCVFHHHQFQSTLSSQYPGKSGEVRSQISLPPIKIMDKNLQGFRLADVDAANSAAKNDQDVASKKCNQCGFSSKYSSVLRGHLKAHNGEKSNKCNLCDYTSSYASNLRTHLKTHSGEKTNKCNLCDYKSSQCG